MNSPSWKGPWKIIWSNLIILSRWRNQEASMICPRPQSLSSSPPNFLNASSAFPPPRSVAVLHWRMGILGSLFPKTWPNPLWQEVCACPNSLQGSHFSRTLTITRSFSSIYNDNVIITGTETGTQNSWVGAKAAPSALWTTQHPTAAGSSPETWQLGTVSALVSKMDGSDTSLQKIQLLQHVFILQT